jgi:hypothetical protein
MKARARRMAWVGLLAITLAACGGGGGAGDGETGGGNNQQPTSGLVPAAPAIGATLVDDATTLRPLQSGATWRYRGTQVPYTGAAPVTYETTTRHSDVGPTSATERTSNAANTGADQLAINVAAGQVSQTADFNLTGTPETVSIIELRSPVRVGDQYVSIDRRYTQTGLDADGDKKDDTIDFAIYTRVIGAETLTLPNLPPLQAIRVDEFAKLRVKYSSSGQYSEVLKFKLSTWYAAGIGIVRQSASSPDGYGDVETIDEQLESWDGISTGLGAMAPVAAVVPAGNAVFPGQTLPAVRSTLFAFAFGDHALVLSDQPGQPESTVASRVDLRGQVLETTVLAGIRMSDSGVMAADSGGVVYLERQAQGAGNRYDLTRIDADGRLVGTVRGQSLTALGGSHAYSTAYQVVAALDGSTLWVLWDRTYEDPSNGNLLSSELVLRPFGLDGAPLADEVIVDHVEGDFLSLAASGGRVLLTWTRMTTGFDVMYGSLTLGGSLRKQSLLGGQAVSNSFVSPLLLGDGGALLWPALLGSGENVGVAGGLLLDKGLLPVPAGSTPLDDQIPDLPSFDWIAAAPAVVGSRIVVSATQWRPLLPDEALSQEVDSVNWIDTGSTPLAHSMVSSVRYPTRRGIRQAAFSDRVLVFGGTDSLTTTVVWLNDGR